MLPDISNSTIRQRAWELCRKNYMKILSITLTVSLVTWVAELALSLFAFNAALALITSLMLSIITTVLQFGMSLFALHVWRGEPAGTGDLTAMMAYVPRIIGIILLIAAVTAAPTLVLSVSYSLVPSMPVIALLVIAISFIVVFWLTLRISLTPLAFLLNPETGATDCIRASWNASRGHVWRIFCNSTVLNLPLIIALTLMGRFFVEGSLIYGIITLLFQTLFNGYIALGETGLGELLLTGRSMCAPYSVDSQQPGQPEDAFRLESGDDDADN